MILIISLCMAFLYVPAKMKRAPFTLSGDTDACFARSETVCNTRAVSKFFFWNLTNADAVVAGTAPPALREIGPFVMHKGKEKKSNVTFHGARDDRVSYVATSYAEWDESSFCEGCSLDDVVVSFNPAYYTLVHAFGSETNFLYSLTPRVVSSSWTPSPRCFSRSPRTRRPPRRCRTSPPPPTTTRARPSARWRSRSGATAHPRRREHHHASAPRGDPREVSRRARVWRVRLDGRGRRDGRLRRRGLRRRVGVDVRRARDVFKRRPRTSSNPRRRPRDVVGRVRDARAFRERVRGARRPVVRSRRGRGRDGSVSRPVVLRVIRGENRPRVDPGLRRSAHVVARRPVGSEVFSSRGDQDVSRGRSRRSERDRSRPVDGGRRVVVARTGRDAVDRRHGARRSGARVGRLGVHQGRRAQRHVRVRRRRR